MSLASGSRFGDYEIRSPLGAGGMGEVYRARDTKLHRDVAIKVLNDSFALDADRVGRLQREAVLLAGLNHPAIAVIHGLEESGGTQALVLELIEGPTLADRIAQGPIPIDDALPIARQIADALQAAHDSGVIHRDLKPANIKLRPDGLVKVLDFGLAKMLDPQGARGSLANSPTMAASMPGMLVGTAAYMSPQQAKGQDVNRRVDVWAFGCVLFEMLTGRPAFDGSTTSEVLAEVLKSEPDWAQLPAETPESLRRLLRRCLHKNEAQRLHDLGDARLELDEAHSERQSPPSATTSGTLLRRGERLAWAVTVALLVLTSAGVVAWMWPRPPTVLPPEARFDIATPPASDPFELASVALSPDGRTLVFTGSQEHSSLWLRPLAETTSRPLPGSEGGLGPFWSPDGRSVAFAAEGMLKRLDLDGGLVRPLTKATVLAGGTWNRDGQILFAPNPASPILKISAAGGPSSEVTTLAEGHAGHSYPHFLPDGRHFVYYVTAGPDVRGVYLAELDGPPPRRLLDADSSAVYLRGHLLFLRRTTLVAQPFDDKSLELRGTPFEVASGVMHQALGLWYIPPAAGEAIAFRAGTAHFGRRFEWVDRAGQSIAGVGDETNAISFSRSPDGNQVVFFRRGDASSDLWTLDTRRAAVSRLTSHPAEDIFPVWSRDGTRIIFTSNRGGQVALYQKRQSGSDAEELLLRGTREETFPADTTPDGLWLLYQRRSSTTDWDVWKMPLDGSGQPSPVVQTNFDERNPSLSPDGKWLAYMSNSAGSYEVYVRPFPGPGSAVQVSTKGGVQPAWRADGRELFYLAPDGTLMAISIRIAPDAQTPDLGPAVPLFASHLGRVVDVGPTPQYMPSADGKRFLINLPVQDTSNAPIRVILNWQPQTQ